MKGRTTFLACRGQNLNRNEGIAGQFATPTARPSEAWKKSTGWAPCWVMHRTPPVSPTFSPPSPRVSRLSSVRLRDLGATHLVW